MSASDTRPPEKKKKKVRAGSSPLDANSPFDLTKRVPRAKVPRSRGLQQSQLGTRHGNAKEEKASETRRENRR